MRIQRSLVTAVFDLDFEVIEYHYVLMAGQMARNYY